MITLLRQYWQISEDTRALLEGARPQGQNRAFGRTITLHGGFSRAAAWTLATAACLVLGVLGWWAIPNRGTTSTGLKGPVVSSGENAPLVIESMDDGRRVAAGAAIRTAAQHLKSLVLNGRHQVVMNGSTSLSIEPLVEQGRTGCLVNLAVGEIYVRVEHDGRPFLVRTPQGKAVITGTTFDVKATQAGTTLAVVEGCVQFESEAGAVQVMARQKSVIVAASVTPSAPTACDVIALTAWARPANEERQIVQDIQPEDFLSDDVLATLSLWAQVPTDLDRIDYAQWVEQKRAWFRQQFPWIFELQAALRGEGIEVDYPALLIQSGDLWRFAYPPANLGRQVEPDPDGLLRVVVSCGRDGSWLRQQGLPSLQPAGRGQQTAGSEAFEQWGRALEAQTNRCGPRADPRVRLDARDACLYLANTRMLAALELRCGLEDMVPEVRGRVLGLLEEELRILAQCMHFSHRVNLGESAVGTCAPSPNTDRPIDAVTRIGVLETAERRLLDETEDNLSAR